MRAETPCRAKCPKYKLYPPGFGLRPENELAVQLYSLACQDIRAGMSGVLMGTLTMQDAAASINSRRVHVPHWLAEQQLLTLMFIIDEVATSKRQKKEEMERDRLAKMPRT